MKEHQPSRVLTRASGVLLAGFGTELTTPYNPGIRKETWWWGSQKKIEHGVSIAPKIIP
ncbi:MAG: hypothetical protein JNJ94_10605 [Chlorobi bacterium]|nr:hypothetical protein [Chlorobiota bacterium]